MIALRFMLSIVILMILNSCTITPSKETVETEKPKPFDDHELAVSDLSMALTHTIGMAIVKDNDQYSVDLTSDISPAAQSGMETGYILKAINGIKIDDFSKERVERLIEHFADNETVFSVKNATGSEKDITVIYNRDNCPQMKMSDFVFISSYDSDNMPSILHVAVVRGIEKLTFNHHAINWLRHFDTNNIEWYISEPEFHELEPIYDLNDFQKVTSSAYYIDYHEQSGEGTLGFMDDRRLHLRYEISDRYNHHVETLIGPAWLESGPIVFAGHALIRHATDYYLKPYYVNRDSEIKRQLNQDSRHMEDRVQDWLVLVDQSGGFIEIEISGKESNWHGFYLPPAEKEKSGIHLCLDTKKNTPYSYNDISFNWYENVAKGYESYPYPEEIIIELISADNQIHTLRINAGHPEYLDNGQRIFCVVNAAYSCSDSHEHFLSGFLMRTHEVIPM